MAKAVSDNEYYKSLFKKINLLLQLFYYDFSLLILTYIFI